MTSSAEGKDRLNAEKLELVRIANSKLKGSLSSCTICPRKCRVDRRAGKTGYCRAGLKPRVYSFQEHHGEEPPISGSRGSGTIFFSNCNMRCAYCQNYTFSQLDEGIPVDIVGLSKMMLSLGKRGCHNINLVSPTHFVPQILSALKIAIENGLMIPIVYNTSGYELVETIRLLEGIVDIYLPDMRYSDNKMASKYSDAPDYVDYNRPAVLEMYRQAGDLAINDETIALRGLIVRLLAIPNNISGTINTLKYIADNISKKTYLSIMSQYYPTFKAYNYNELSRGVDIGEYQNIVDEAKLLGLNNGWIQETPQPTDKRYLGTNIQPRTEMNNNEKDKK